MSELLIGTFYRTYSGANAQDDRHRRQD